MRPYIIPAISISSLFQSTLEHAALSSHGSPTTAPLSHALRTLVHSATLRMLFPPPPLVFLNTIQHQLHLYIKVVLLCRPLSPGQFQDNTALGPGM
jgi:hypothetical protein